eukprot:7159489-Ditylum_brightwellii.AAC.1
MHDWLNTGHQKQISNKDTVTDCPVCNETKETWTHMFQCQHKNSIAIQTLAVTTFRSTLLKLETALINGVVLQQDPSQELQTMKLERFFAVQLMISK